MKTKLSLIILLSFIFYFLSSQIPQGFNYQAIVRNTDGEVLQNKSLKVTVAITAALTGGAVIREEYHDVTSNQFGLVSFSVGSGTYVSGPATSFDLIDWKAQPLYLKTTVEYPVGTVTEMGTSQILSVPYSLVAKDVEGPIEKLGIKGSETSLDSTLFEVKNKQGNTVFAVYPEGVRVYVADGAKGKKGGFAVGSFGEGKTESQKYLVVSKDSVRIYLDSDPATKKPKGGFAVGGYDMSKGFPEDYLRVTRDSTRVYVNDVTGKGKKGGFAVGSFDASKKGQDTIFTFTSLTPENYLIGHESGKRITSGLYNSTMGYQSGSLLTTGSSNVLIGFQAGKLNSTGAQNVMLGYLAGPNNSSGGINVFVGSLAGNSNSTGSANVFLGAHAGISNTTGYQNVFIGDFAGSKNEDINRNVYIGYESAGRFANAGYNTFVGCQTGADITNGSANTFIGYHAGVTTAEGHHNVYIGMKAAGATDGGIYNRSGDYNVYVGSYAGHQHAGSRNILIGYLAGGKSNSTFNPGLSGSGNIFLGYMAGYEEMGSDKLYIDNSNTSTPLIFGDFTDGSEKLVFNGKVGIGAAPGTYALYVNGSTLSTTGWSSSDVRWKKNIEPLENVLNGILRLEGVQYQWKADEFPEINFDSGQQLGLIAQEVEKVYPQLVKTDDNGFKAISYEKLSVLLIEGMKEQQQQIESTKQENQQLKTELQVLKDEVDQLKSMFIKGGNN